MSEREGTCRTCGQGVRRWHTSTGWKHVRSGTSVAVACKDSPPHDVDEGATEEPADE